MIQNMSVYVANVVCCQFITLSDFNQSNDQIKIVPEINLYYFLISNVQPDFPEITLH